MPVLPVCLLEPRWAQFLARLPERPLVSPTHPLGCHRQRIPDRVVFAQVLAALVHGSGYERFASPGCSDATIRRRLKEWAAAGVSEQVHTLAPRAYDRMSGLELDDLAVDGGITEAPGGGELAAAECLAGAAQIISSEEGGLQLRYLQTLGQIANDRQATIIFPLPIDITRGLLQADDGNGTNGSAPASSPVERPTPRPTTPPDLSRRP